MVPPFRTPNNSKYTTDHSDKTQNVTEEEQDPEVRRQYTNGIMIDLVLDFLPVSHVQ